MWKADSGRLTAFWAATIIDTRLPSSYCGSRGTPFAADFLNNFIRTAISDDIMHRSTSSHGRPRIPQGRVTTCFCGVLCLVGLTLATFGCGGGGLPPTPPAPPTAALPGFSPAPGTYSSAQSVTVTDSTPDATIYYTTDGSTPTSTKYTGPISVSTTTTINAIATATGYGQSLMATATYTILIAAAPTFSPGYGTYTAVQSVTLMDTTSSATIYYTTDGSIPTTSSTRYTGPISVSTTTTINAIATATGYGQSPVATATYTINLPPAAAPTFSPFRPAPSRQLRR